MNVLVACEESQRVCSAFRAKGHNAFSCDILPCSGDHPEWHIQGDVLTILNPENHRLWEDGESFIRGIEFRTMDGQFYFVQRWDLIIAHPPCTFMSKASACRMYPQAGKIDPVRYSKALAAREFFFQY